MVIHVFPKDFMHVYFLSFLRRVSYFFPKKFRVRIILSMTDIDEDISTKIYILSID